MKKILLILLLAIIGFGSKSIGQNTCVDALQIYPQDSLISESINASDSVLWLKFTASDTAFYLNLVKSDTSALSSIYLYHATNGCNNYIQVESAINKVFINSVSLVVNDQYFVKITQNINLSYSLLYSSKQPGFGVSAGFSTSTLYPYLYQNYSLQENILNVCVNDYFWLRPVVPFNMPEPTIMFKFSMIIYNLNGDIINSTIQPLDYNVNNLACSFSIPTAGIYYVDLVIWDINVTNPQFQGPNINSNPNYSFYPSHKFYINVLGPPDSDILNVPSPVCVGSHLELINQIQTGYTFNFGNLNVHQTLNGMIYTDCPCPGTYPISATVDNDCGVTTTNYVLKVSLLPQLFTADTICPKDTIDFIGTSCIDNNNYYLQYCTYLWNFGDGYTSNIKNTIHAYSTPGVYTVTFTIFYNDQSGCVSSESVTKNIVVIMPEKPLIMGNHSNCDKEGSQYKIQNYNPNYTYHWYLKNGYGTINNISNGVITIDWFENTYGCPYDTLVVKGIDEYGCSDTSYFLIYSCCYGNTGDIVYFDEVTFSTNALFDNNINNYVFNENVIINANIEFKDATVHMGPNTKIIVNPDAKLTINNTEISSLIDCCNDMWDGIYVENPLSELYINNKSIIQNAQNAVVSRNKGFISLLNSTLKDNYRNVIIEDYSLTLPYDYTPYPASINSCIFTVSIPNGSNYHLLQNQPYAGMQSYSGIETKNILNLTIGDYSDPLYKNTFEYFFCGIKGINSNLYIYNNDFIDIRLADPNASLMSFGNNPTAIYQPTAIHSVFDNSLKGLPVSELVVGGLTDPYKYNGITNSVNGIYSYNQRVDIRGNTIEADNYGIRNKDVYDRSWVSYNNINSTSHFVGYGIDIVNIQPAYVNLNVNDNIVFPTAKGISVSNCLSDRRNGTYLTDVYNNHVFFHPDNYDIYNLRDRSGIISSNSDGIVISCNEVARLLASEPDQYARLFGINVVQTMHAQVRDNYNLHKLGAGINVYSNCNYSNYQCNSLKYNYHGFMFNNFSTLTQQGSDYTNTDNYFEGSYWNSSLQTYRKLWANSSSINGTVNWHVRTNPFPLYSLDNSYIYNPTNWNIFEVQNSSSAGSACGDCQVQSIEGEINWNPEKREEIYGKTVRNEVVYDTLNTEFTTYDQEMLYRLLKEDSTLMNMGDTSDIAYQQFYAANQNSNIGKIVETQELIKKGELDEALLRNEAVQDQKLIDYYMKEVNNIYLSTYARSNYQLSAQQIDFLTTIANLTPWEGGDAVFIARFMLDIDENQLTSDFAKAPAAMPNNMESRANMAKLYPNPAQDEVMIAFEKATDAEGVLEIYGFTGSVIQSQSLASGYQFISVSVKDLKPGIYFYRILLNNEVVAKDKLLIVK